MSAAALCLGLAAVLSERPAPPPDACQKHRLALPTGRAPQHIEEAFAAHGVLRLQGVDYRLSDGIFQSLQGRRAWVSAPRHPPQPDRAAGALLVEEAAGVRCGAVDAKNGL